VVGGEQHVHYHPTYPLQPDHGSTVYQVCNAIALAYLASTTYWPRAAVAHVRAYGSALTAVNSALKIISDEVMTARS